MEFSYVKPFLTVFFIALLNFSLGYGQEIDPLFAQCGGALEGDSGILSFPELNQNFTPGQICVWTVHLKTLQDFRISFADFNVTSTNNNSNCQNSGVQIYSLTNLASGPDPESYLFCDESQPSNPFFIGKSVITILFYSSSPSSKFSLAWEGATFDPARTTHASNLLRSSSAPIQYPIVGSYEPNLVATWLIKAEDIDAIAINLQNLELQSCSAPDPCFCDALFIYEVVSNLTFAPTLKLTQRFCSNVTTTINVPDMNNIFIVALFTDPEVIPPSGLGKFDLVYYPMELATTTSMGSTIRTTEETQSPTETTESPDPYLESYNCGEVLDGPKGRIIYKIDSRYNPMERCIWVVRSRKSTKINFRLVQSGIEDNKIDTLSISGFRQNVLPEVEHDDFLHDKHILVGVENVTVNGSVATIFFSSGSSTYGTGFVLEFEGTQDLLEDAVSSFSKDYILEGNNGSMRFPATGSYSDNEVSIFVFRPPGDIEAFPALIIKLTPNASSALESCYDTVRIYNFKGFGQGFAQDRRLCQYDFTPIVNYQTDSTTMMVFISDSSQVYQGFTLEYSYT